MGAIESPSSKWADLIRPEHVHGSLYTDPANFQEELEKVWYTTWVYVGHVSEVPNPNDFVMKFIGLQQVLLTRDQKGEIHLIQNRCSHRGNRVVDVPHGNARTFTCNYHGWTFGNDGSLRGYPFPSGFENDKRGDPDLGLGRVPRMGIYKGFVFGSFAEQGPSLEEHLGGAKDRLDMLCRNSPTGEIEITAGFLAHQVNSNWKFLSDNETDGYHPAFTHASIFEVADSRIPELYGEKSISASRYFGNGHCEIDLRPEFRRRDEPLSWFGTTPDKLPEYVAQMEAAYGKEKAHQIMVEGSPHLFIYPNLFIAEIQIFVFQPLSVDATVQHCTAIQFKGATDMNRRLRQQTMGSVGPAGFLLADDAEMYERSHRGVDDKYPEWIYFGRGKYRERKDENGYLVGHVTDDGCSRGMWAYYRSLMEAK